jgi:hypothetical protein
VSGAIVGARSPAQVDGWIGAAGLTLDDEDLADIDGSLGAVLSDGSVGAVLAPPSRAGGSSPEGSPPLA